MYETSLCCCIGNHVKPLESFQIYFDVLRVTNTPGSKYLAPLVGLEPSTGGETMYLELTKTTG